MQTPNAEPTSLLLPETTLQRVQHDYALAQTVLRMVKTHNLPDPLSGPTFPIAQAGSLVGRSASAIRMAEGEGRLPSQERTPVGRRQGYTLEQLDHMRDIFGTHPWRSPEDPPAIIACQNFKGGVGKSTISIHLAQYLAVNGYRVLLIDADAQASTTMAFGILPDADIDESETVYPALMVGEYHRPIEELIRKTHYFGLDLIPANLTLYNAEYELAARIAKHGFSVLATLAKEIYRVSSNYDVIILDPPPALGMISLSVLYAANALVIPMPPSLVDFASTTSFLGMLSKTLETLGDAQMRPEYGFVHMLLSKREDNYSQNLVADYARRAFGNTILETELKVTAEIGNATSQFQSVYDLSGPTTNGEVRRRCLKQLNDVNREIEKQIRKLWPNTIDPRK